MLKSKFLTTILIIIIALLSLALIRVRQPINNLNAEIKHTNDKLAEAQRKNEELELESDYLKNESYIERQLRLKLNYKKPGEEAVLIYRTEATAQESQNTNFFSRQYDNFSNWVKSIFD